MTLFKLHSAMEIRTAKTHSTDQGKMTRLILDTRLPIEVAQLSQPSPVSRSQYCVYEWPRLADPTGGS